ncbi:MAG: YlxR family protein [Candidatus Viridilinea halotolerans]|uniref:YlxR family protein n=1 Tax=Candidatus Viridilinea halotolerans TaxID=2491704 RepID=A0A426TZ75_9CHLR|nr:MAG: YlxR family protein [Candidatus Viridilinea halotolerans]
MAVGSEQSGANLRPKHVPQRMCVACRQNDAKRGLVRLVRDGDGRVAVDATGRRNGRGAYLCPDPQCWDVAVRRRALERALRLERLHPDDRAALLAFAAGLATHAPG